MMSSEELTSNDTTIMENIEGSAQSLVTIWASPFVIVCGTLGNILICVVLPRLRELYAFSYYTLALALSQFLMLTINLLPRWMESVIHLRLTVEGHWLCKIDAFNLYFFHTLSALFLAALSGQRAMAVVWPYSQKTRIQIRAAKVVIGSITTYALAACSGILLADTMDISDCYLGSAKGFNVNRDGMRQTWINLINGFFLPLVILFVSHVMLVAVNLKQREIPFSSTQLGERSVQRSRTRRYVTVVVVALTFGYCILVGPTLVLECLITIKAIRHDVISKTGWAVLVQMLFGNNMLNFFVHFFSGSEFQREAIRVGFCRRALHNFKTESTFQSGRKRSLTTSGGRSTIGPSMITSMFSAKSQGVQLEDEVAIHQIKVPTNISVTLNCPENPERSEIKTDSASKSKLSIKWQDLAHKSSAQSNTSKHSIMMKEFAGRPEDSAQPLKPQLGTSTI